MTRMLPGYLNPEQPRCGICDARCRNQSHLIAHQLLCRGSTEQIATTFREAVAKGLLAEDAGEGECT